MSSLILSREVIVNLLCSEPPLVEGILDREQQVQPNGIDLTLRDVSAFESGGVIALDNRHRVLSGSKLLSFNAEAQLELAPGCYQVTYNEIVHLPKDLMALGAPRSSLLRCGASMHTAVWDAGYSGRSQSLLVVYNEHGIRLEKNARILQLVFLRLGDAVQQGYSGIFQRENV